MHPHIPSLACPYGLALASGRTALAACFVAFLGLCQAALDRTEAGNRVPRQPVPRWARRGDRERPGGPGVPSGLEDHRRLLIPRRQRRRRPPVPTGPWVEPEEEKVWGRDGVLRTQEDGHVVAILPPSAFEHHAPQLLIYRQPWQPPHQWTLLCAWFSGVEGRGTVSLMVSRLEWNASHWSPPVQAVAHPGRSLQNPVWLWDELQDSILLMHTSQKGMDQGTALVQVVESKDGGKTWDGLRTLFSAPGAFLKNHPLRDLAGNWLLPMYYTPRGMSNVPSQYSELRRSQDGGQSWSFVANLAEQGTGLVQPSVVRLQNSLPDGRSGQPSPNLVAFFRSRRRDYVWRSESRDDGTTWTAPAALPLPNPNKAVQAIALASGSIALIFDNNHRGRRFFPLSIGLSPDGGVTWPHVRDLEPEFDPRLEYTYPSVVQTPDGGIHLAYTWSRGRRRVGIRYMRITEDWVKGSWPCCATRGVYQPPRN
eukprot:CAMPEP_0117655368 /NCGR_PEP_ID=MMETSP0804-20121206/4242_1 /TAXON_ID=1074897 /ORGANISM="Tetraselmis astigmatica, Strain CCMP880" /LENGTH=479 /DNA_ID=CAMNT_0005461715 /DNA_START=264 /DNA_END=1703 /DNA_ORIENTATION=-